MLGASVGAFVGAEVIQQLHNRRLLGPVGGVGGGVQQPYKRFGGLGTRQMPLVPEPDTIFGTALPDEES